MFPNDPNAGAGPADQGDGAQGDGFQHCQIDENESGAHTTHTDANGQVTEADHPSYEDAISSLGKNDEESGETEPDNESAEGDLPDFSRAYSQKG